MARFGLDIGRGGVKLVREDRGGALRAAERAVTGEGPERRAAVVAALKELAAELGVRARDEVAVAVPRAEAIVKRLVLPRVPHDELERLIRFQAQKDLPFELSDVVLAWGRAGAAEGEAAAGADEVVVAAVRKDAVEEARAVLREAGLRPGALEVSTQAAARALVAHAGAGAGEALLVEVGRATTDIIVLEQGRLAYSRSASVGCGADPEADDAWLERLSQEVGRTLVAARAARQATAGGAPPEAVFVGGGGAAHPALAEALEARLGVRPQVLDVLGDGDPARGARFVVARGLLASVTEGLPCLDLADTTRVHQATRTRRHVVAGVAAALLAFAGVVAGIEARGRARAADAARLQQEKDLLKPRVDRARALQAELELARRWEERRGRELEVLLVLSRALPAEKAFLTSLRWVDERPVSLAGRAKDWDEVGRFLTALEHDPLVAKARLEGIRGTDGPAQGKEGVEFTGTAELREPGAVAGGAK
ncbi:MAG: pilus assembly protein PilM [Planctomycetes bacterium]|nr:pilus assembly protein PilM [Planctomycetota bacterium]